FRAHNDVSDKAVAKLTTYLRPDSQGKPGEARQNDVDLPWNSMSFVLGEQTFSVCYLNHPSNPENSKFSERDYGRFGCYFVRELTPDDPVQLDYRIWVQRGPMTRDQVRAISDSFVTPPTPSK